MFPRRQLAIECSSFGGSVALLEIAAEGQKSQIKRQITLSTAMGSARTLAPSLEELLDLEELLLSDLEFISVTVGPGSFTGLRVGLTTVKMLGWAANKPIVPIGTLAATSRRFANELLAAEGQLAQNAAGQRPIRLVTAINAFRKQVFTNSWSISVSEAAGDGLLLRSVQTARVMDASQWNADPWGSDSISRIPTADVGYVSDPSGWLWVTGNALASYPFPMPSLADSTQLRFAPAAWWVPMAEHVGELGWLEFSAGKAVSADRLQPDYLRASAAEEKVMKDKSVPGAPPPL